MKDPQSDLGGFFESYLASTPLFNSKKTLQSTYVPETILHRKTQIGQIARILAPSLRKERPSNLFIYGKTGTGKTLSVKHTTTQLLITAEKQDIPLHVMYVNCKLKKVADTEYRIIAHIARELGEDIPITGLPTDEIYKIFFNAIEKQAAIIILIIDEVDHLVKKIGDEVLYNLTRINEDLKNSQLTLIGVSNDLVFVDHLDPRVKSSLSEEEILFPPYNALQIRDILMERASVAFRKECVGTGVIEKCAAYAAREHGDSRRALELLRVAGELAERAEQKQVTIANVDAAEAKIERDRIYDTLLMQPPQIQLTFYSILLTYNPRKNTIFTGEVYERYKELCTITGLRPLTQRRMSDMLAELDMFGIINARIISKGRYGRTREISLGVPHSLIPKLKKTIADTLNIPQNDL